MFKKTAFFIRLILIFYLIFSQEKAWSAEFKDSVLKEALQSFYQEEYVPAVESLRYLVVWYPDKEFSLPFLSDLLIRWGNKANLEKIEQNPSSPQALESLKKVLSKYKESLPRELLSLLVSLKYPKSDLNKFARGTLIKEYETRLNGLLNEEQKALFKKLKKKPGSPQGLKEVIKGMESKKAGFLLSCLLFKFSHTLLAYESQLLWANLDYNEGRLKEAEEKYRLLLFSSPPEEYALPALENLANIFLRQKNYDKAFLNCRQIFAHSPGYKLKDKKLKNFYQREKAKKEKEKREREAREERRRKLAEEEERKRREFEEKEKQKRLIGLIKLNLPERIVFSYYASTIPIPLVSALLKGKDISHYSNTIDTRPHSKKAVKALNNLISLFPSSAKDHIPEIIHLFIFLKYPLDEVGIYAKGMFLSTYEETLASRGLDLAKLNPAEIAKIANVLDRKTLEPHLFYIYLLNRYSQQEINLHARTGLAELFLEESNYSLALKEYQKALLLSSPSQKFSLQNKIGLCYERLNQLDQAIEFHEKASLSSTPDIRLFSSERIASIYYRLGRTQDSFLTCKKIEKDYPGHIFKDKELNTFFKKTKSEESAKMRKGKERKQKEKERNLAKIKRGLKDLLQEIVLVYYPQGNSMPLLSTILDYPGLSLTAATIDALPESEEAVKSLEQLIQYSSPLREERIPELIALLVSLKYPFSHVGDYAQKEFIRIYEDRLSPETREKQQSIEKDPNSKKANASLNEVALSFSSTPFEADLFYLYLLNKYPDTQAAFEARTKLGDFYYEREKYQIALNEYLKVPYPPAHLQNKIGLCNENLGQFDQALNFYEKASLSSDTEIRLSASERVASIYYRLGQTQKALLICKRIEREYPDYIFENKQLNEFFDKTKNEELTNLQKEKERRQKEEERSLTRIKKGLKNLSQEIILVYYPQGNSMPLLSTILDYPALSLLVTTIDALPDSEEAVNSLEQLIQHCSFLREEKNLELIPLIVFLKYPFSRVGDYAQKEFVRIYEAEMDPEIREKQQSIEKKPESKEVIALLNEITLSFGNTPFRSNLFCLYLLNKYPETQIAFAARAKLGDFYYGNKEYQIALNEYLKVPYPSAHLQNKIGLCYEKLNQFDRALEFYQKASSSEDKEKLFSLKRLISIYYHQLKDYSQSFNLCEELKKEFPESHLKDEKIERFFTQEKTKRAKAKKEKEKFIAEERERKIAQLKSLLKRVIFDYYPQKSMPLISAIFKDKDISNFTKIIDTYPNHRRSIKALKRIIHFYPPSPELHIPDLIYLVVWLKYPEEKVGEFSRKEFVKAYSKRIKKKDLIFLNENPDGQETLSVLNSLFDETEKKNKTELPLLGLYLIAKYPETKLFQEAVLQLGDFYFAEKRYEFALGQYETAPYLESRPDILQSTALCWHYLKDDSKAFEIYKRLKKSFSDYQITPLLEEVAANYEKRITWQIACLKEEIASNPDQAEETLDKIAALSFGKDRLISIYQEIISEYPDTQLCIYSQTRLADALLTQGKVKEALEEYRNILKKYPQSLYAKFAREGLADCLHQEKKYLAALKEYRTLVLECLEKDNLRKGELFSLKTEPNYENYQPEADELQEHFSQEIIAETKYLKGHLLFSRERIKEAISVWKESLSLYENLGQAKLIKEKIAFISFNLLLACRQVQRYQEAAKYGLKALDTFATLKKRQDLREYKEKILSLFQLAKRALDYLKEGKENIITAHSRGNLHQKMVSFYREVISSEQGEKYLLKNLSPCENALIEALQHSVIKGTDQTVFSPYKELFNQYSRVQLRPVSECVLIYLLITRDSSRAIREIRKSFEDSRKKILFQVLADLSLELRESKLAIKSYQELANLYTEEERILTSLEKAAEIAQRIKWTGQAMEIYREIVNKYPQNKRAIAVQQKIIELYAQEWKLCDNAIQECQRMIKLFPQTPEAIYAHFLIGQYYYQDKQYDNSVFAFQKFIDAYPGNKQVQQAYLFIGLNYLAKWEYTKAIGAFRYLVEEYPEHQLASKAQFLIGYSYIIQQQYAKAKAEYQEVVEKYPKSSYARQAGQFIDRLAKVTE